MSMLPKRQRLTKQAFDAAFKAGKRYHTPLLQLIVVPGETFHGAAVVGKRVYKKAVDRNRLRRQLYGVLYRYQQTHGMKGTYIVIAKPPLAAAQKTTRVATLAELLNTVASR